MSLGLTTFRNLSNSFVLSLILRLVACSKGVGREGRVYSAIKLSVGWVVRAGPSTARQLSSHSLLGLCGQRISRNLTACFHIITAFPSPALLSMLSKMFCSVLTESVALIIHNATPLLPSCWWPPSLSWFITHYIVSSTDLFIIVTYVSLVMRYTQ